LNPDNCRKKRVKLLNSKLRKRSAVELFGTLLGTRKDRWAGTGVPAFEKKKKEKKKVGGGASARGEEGNN